MEDNHHRRNHVCKFCYKRFPCGRSLGGHMRSHMIDVSPDDYDHSKGKIPKKKLPPLSDFVSLRIQEKKPSRYLKSSRDCKECGKRFSTWQALFGHMKCHNGKVRTEEEEVSWDSCNNEAAAPLIRRKRSDRSKRYKANTTSSSLTVGNFSPSVSEIDQQDEEVALCLILLSRDNENQCFTEELSNRELKPVNSLKRRRSEVSAHTLCEDDEPEVNSPRKTEVESKNSRKRMSFNKSNDSELSNLPVGCKNMASSSYVPRACNEISQNSDCKRSFPSYQVPSGHRASHRKFKGPYDPTNSSSKEAEDSSNPCSNAHSHDDDDKLIEFARSLSSNGEFTRTFVMRDEQKINKEHECSICNRVFTSGQSLGGHKRSHVIEGIDHQAKTRSSKVLHHHQKPIKETRDFIDLNMPAPVEEACSSNFKPWWT